MGRKNRKAKGEANSASFLDPRNVSDPGDPGEPSVPLRNVYDRRNDFSPTEILSSLENVTANLGQEGWLHPIDTEVIWVILGSLCDRLIKNEDLKRMAKIIASKTLYDQFPWCCTHILQQDVEDSGKKLKLEFLLRAFCEVTDRYLTSNLALPIHPNFFLELYNWTLDPSVLILNIKPKITHKLKSIHFKISDNQVDGGTPNQIEPHRNPASQVRNIMSNANVDHHMVLEESPNDIANWNIVPNQEDIFWSGQVYLRPNFIRGFYPDLKTYQDVQFRLLMEDFMRPLRQGMVKFLSEKHQESGPRGVRELRIYKNARPLQFLHSAQVPERETAWRLCLVEFQASRNIKWSTGRRLIHGSLVCLWDRSNKQLVIASVAKSTPEELASGRLTLAIETPFIPIDFMEKEYDMLESTVFFEPYRAVLQVIQNFTKNSFPMMDYFLSWTTQLVPPSYLEEHSGYVLRNLNDTTTKIQNLLNFPAWPNAEQLGLDERQHEALQIALTSRVALIQGPPGTGKTFLALRIMRTLLDNKHLWQGKDGGIERSISYMKSTFKEGDDWNLKNKLFWKKFGEDWLDERAPVVVICLTNHALDQFLTGILDSTNRIIRIGGQSKSPNLECFNLHRIKSNVKMTQIYGPYCDSNYLYYNYKMNELRAKIEVDIESKIRNTQFEILKVDELKNRKVISAEMCEVFEQAERQQTEQKKKRNREDNILKWWLGWSNHRQLLKVLREMRNKRSQMTKKIPAAMKESIVENLQDDTEGTDSIDDDIMEETSDDEDYREEVRLSKQQANLEISDNNPREYNGVIRQRLDTAVNDEDKSLLSFAKNQIEQMQFIRDHLLAVEPNDIFQEEDFSADQIMTMPLSQRWMLFAQWKRSYEEIINEELQEFKEKIKEYNQLKGQALAALCRTADVIGMTTTGAAKNRLLLESLKAKIVIVEEAAEVLESHIVCSLTPDCQHLIMIGDHQQLRPSVNVHELARQYHLDVSLFERLIMGGMKTVKLGVQHRMRPEIARLIVPAIYAQLENHSSVYSHPQVPGMAHDIFFYHHTHPENEDGSSFYNEHEVAMALQLALYLVRNQYVSANRITILATYAAQLHRLLHSRRRLMKELAQVRMTVVDNYQGEENDVIILSLVRNNKRNSVGFLRTDNRVCVALSRARNGLYILGNIRMLSAASPLWSKMEKVLMENGEIGEEIQLRCKRNHQTIYKVNRPEDFPIGNFCRELCGADLPCGHACKLVCHKDGSHTKKCQENVIRELPCGHTQLVPCSTPIAKALCQEPVMVTKEPCMHEIQIRCCKKQNHANEVPCTSLVFKNLTCGHIKEIPCFMPPDALDPANACKEKIEYILECSHVKKIACGMSETHRMLLNASCKEKVHKKLLCGHSKWMKCYEDPEEFECGITDERKLDCGHISKFVCPGKPVVIPCLTMVDQRMPQCGHIQKSICSSPLERCKKEIVRHLDCGHDVKCPCWNKTPTCTSVVEKMLMCGHLQSVRCIDGIDSVVCDEQVEVLHPLCSHVLLVPCSVVKDEIQLRSFKCTTEPLKMLDCGHELRLPCAQEVDESITCNAMVNYTLPCHHMIIIPCNTSETKAKEKCKFKCGAPLDCDHYCSLTCHDRKTAHECKETVPKKLQCGHQKDIPCFRSPDKEICFTPVSLKLACGHMWDTTCDKVSMVEENICRLPKKKRLVCGHSAMVECCIPAEKIVCKEPMNHKLGCGHSVPTKCGVPFEDKLKLTCTVEEEKKLPCGHPYLLKCGSKEASKPLKSLFCRVMVEKKIPKCGHKVKVECGKQLSKKDCTSVCEKTLICGHPCLLPCREPCAPKSCHHEVELEGTRLPCGHGLKGECCLRYADQEIIQAKVSEVKHCTSTCQARLACDHRCPASCHECQTNRFHSVCVKRCNRTLICGHKCEDKCAKVCPPCKKPCSYQCFHQKCTQTCGDDCTICTENCEWKCPHAQCKHSCSEFCNREPCNEPCPKRFPCGHSCFGLCGEICPPKCPICSKMKIPNFNQKARYIYLECEHFIEVEEMDDWMNENYESEVTTAHKIWCPSCPQCDKPIRLCFRYGDKIKAFYVDLISIKWDFVKDGTIRKTQEWRTKINKACDKWMEPKMAENHRMKLTFSQLKAQFSSTFNNDQCWDLLYRIQLTSLMFCLANDAKKTYEMSYNGKTEKIMLSESSREYLSSKITMGFNYIKKHANSGVGYYQDLYKILNRFDLHRQYFVVEALSTRLPPCSVINQTQLDKAAHLLNGKWTDAGESNLVEWLDRVSNLYNVTLASSAVKKKLIQRLDMSNEMWFKCAKPSCEAVFSRTRYSQCPECLDAFEPDH